ncbi:MULTISPECIES: isopenicillin N synthase family oxygenase [Mesorhizobium]|uniref:2-oxoglutarate-dependent ethylene/succinate-forming enzyme n=1 Tax=Mesorhizobium ciceri TaxID=39645 RepID=A0AB38TFA5_9HYPH|nr:MULTISPECIES: isopenicillin N synthase family oxygenase [Mesorhizobium]MDF3218273.1 isopenicillin N synthase family oxygenase [Mesorhizobium ciceri]UTU53136.1 hypothetical protein LRP29_06850 [Mesorhizobium ciceri]
MWHRSQSGLAGKSFRETDAPPDQYPAPSPLPSAGWLCRGNIIGIGAHTDYGNLTILAQDDVGSLQVMNRDGDWVEGTAIHGTFVINIGDLIQRLTNDVYHANMHRVVNTTGREPYSIPVFIDADFDVQSSNRWRLRHRWQPASL